jgi:hypothetical protein
MAEQQRDLNDLYHAVGGLTAEVKGLRHQLADSDRRTVEHYQRITTRLDAVAKRQRALETRVERTEAAIADLTPTVTEVRIWKQRGIGALAIIGIAGTALGIFISALWSRLLESVNLG